MCGPDDECEAVFCGFYAVVFKWAALSAAVAAESGHSEVEVECGVFFRGEFVGVVGQEEFHLCIGYGCGRHFVGCDEHDSASVAVGECGPAHFFTVAAALRAGVGCEHAGYGCAVESDKLAGLAVGIVFFGSASVVGELREVVGHFHGVAEAGEHCGGVVG